MGSQCSFRESLVIRLHSEIDQIHLSIEAQCVTTLLPGWVILVFSLLKLGYWDIGIWIHQDGLSMGG